MDLVLLDDPSSRGAHRRLEVHQRDDDVAAVNERGRLELVDIERTKRLEEVDHVRATSTGLKPLDVRRVHAVFPFNVVRESLEYRGDIPLLESLVDPLHSLDVWHCVPQVVVLDILFPQPAAYFNA